MNIEKEDKSINQEIDNSSCFCVDLLIYGFSGP